MTPEETAAFTDLSAQFHATWRADSALDQYYEGTQRLEHIGLAVPPELRRFETVVNWPRLAVDAVRQRCKVRSVYLPGEEVADRGLREGWDANGLTLQERNVYTDALVYGRGFVSVGANEESSGFPLIRAESPREMTARVDPRRHRLDAALKMRTGDGPAGGDPDYATLYMPNATVWLTRRDDGRWVEYERDDHQLGRVPVVMFLNRARTGSWAGASEMADVIQLTDAAARALTNLQLAGETHAVPQRWVLGMSKGDFVDAAGEPLPVWQAYFGAIWASENPTAKVGQFTASSLSNFHETVNHYAQLVAGVTGLPMRYLGQNTANPPSADGIRADESRLVLNAEDKHAQFGSPWGWVASLYMRFRDGVWVDGNRIRVDWHDAATPTYAAKVDGIQKLTGGQPILSREGGWDELGWSDARKDRERDHLRREETDPLLAEALGVADRG